MLRDLCFLEWEASGLGSLFQQWILEVKVMKLPKVSQGTLNSDVLINCLQLTQEGLVEGREL